MNDFRPPTGKLRRGFLIKTEIFFAKEPAMDLRQVASVSHQDAMTLRANRRIRCLRLKCRAGGGVVEGGRSLIPHFIPTYRS